MLLASIIIPVLNNKRQLADCLDSILIGTKNLFELEIIIIDGGSSDGTLAIIKEYEKYISYWETGLDSGIADAFNRGISMATGDVIAILNSDDYWHKDTLKHVANAYKQFPDADVFYGDLKFLDVELSRFYIKKPDLKKMKYRMNIFHPAMFVKRKTYKKVGLYRVDFKHAMDAEWCHHALAMERKFHYIPQVLTTMRLGGLSDREFKQSLQEYRKSIIQNGIAKPLEAWVYYGYFLAMKTLMKVSWIKNLKYHISS